MNRSLFSVLSHSAQSYALLAVVWVGFFGVFLGLSGDIEIAYAQTANCENYIAQSHGSDLEPVSNWCTPEVNALFVAPNVGIQCMPDGNIRLRIQPNWAVGDPGWFIGARLDFCAGGTCGDDWGGYSTTYPGDWYSDDMDGLGSLTSNRGDWVGDVIARDFNTNWGDTYRAWGHQRYSDGVMDVSAWTEGSFDVPQVTCYTEFEADLNEPYPYGQYGIETFNVGESIEFQSQLDNSGTNAYDPARGDRGNVLRFEVDSNNDGTADIVMGDVNVDGTGSCSVNNNCKHLNSEGSSLFTINYTFSAPGCYRWRARADANNQHRETIEDENTVDEFDSVNGWRRISVGDASWPDPCSGGGPITPPDTSTLITTLEWNKNSGVGSYSGAGTAASPALITPGDNVYIRWQSSCGIQPCVCSVLAGASQGLVVSSGSGTDTSITETAISSTGTEFKIRCAPTSDSGNFKEDSFWLRYDDGSVTPPSGGTPSVDVEWSESGSGWTGSNGSTNQGFIQIRHRSSDVDQCTGYYRDNGVGSFAVLSGWSDGNNTNGAWWGPDISVPTPAEGVQREYRMYCGPTSNPLATYDRFFVTRDAATPPPPSSGWDVSVAAPSVSPGSLPEGSSSNFTVETTVTKQGDMPAYSAMQVGQIHVGFEIDYNSDGSVNSTITGISASNDVGDSSWRGTGTHTDTVDLNMSPSGYSLPAGTHRIRAVFDDENDLPADTNPANDISGWTTFTVGAAAPPPPPTSCPGCDADVWLSVNGDAFTKNNRVVNPTDTVRIRYDVDITAPAADWDCDAVPSSNWTYVNDSTTQTETNVTKPLGGSSINIRLNCDYEAADPDIAFDSNIINLQVNQTGVPTTLELEFDKNSDGNWRSYDGTTWGAGGPNRPYEINPGDEMRIRWRTTNVDECFVTGTPYGLSISPSTNVNDLDDTIDEPIYLNPVGTPWYSLSGERGWTVTCNSVNGTVTDRIYTALVDTPPQCSDGIDNDGDGVQDATDPGCYTNPSDPSTYDPDDTDETDPVCLDGIDNDGDGVSDQNDPGCYPGPINPTTDPATWPGFDPLDTDETDPFFSPTLTLTAREAGSGSYTATPLEIDDVPPTTCSWFARTFLGCVDTPGGTPDIELRIETYALTECTHDQGGAVSGVPSPFTIDVTGQTRTGTMAGPSSGNSLTIQVTCTGPYGDVWGYFQVVNPSGSTPPPPPTPPGPSGGNTCSDGEDNGATDFDLTTTGDGLIDIADPECHTDGDPTNPSSYEPSLPETDAGTCGDGNDNDSQDGADASDPDCQDGGGNYCPSCDEGTGSPVPAPVATIEACELGGTNCQSGNATFLTGTEIEITWDSPTADSCTAFQGTGVGSGSFSTGGNTSGTDTSIDEPTSGSRNFSLRCETGGTIGPEAIVNVTISAGGGPGTPPSFDRDGTVVIDQGEALPPGDDGYSTGGFTGPQCELQIAPLGTTNFTNTGESLIDPGGTITYRPTADVTLRLYCDDGAGTTGEDTLNVRVRTDLEEV